MKSFSCIIPKFVMHVTNGQFSDKFNNGWKKIKWPIYCNFWHFTLIIWLCGPNNNFKLNNGGGLLSSVLLFFFWNIVAIKSIFGIKCGNAMWFSPVNCPGCCSSLSCDNNSDELRCMKLFKRLTREYVVPLCMSQQLTTPRRLKVSLVLLISGVDM